MQAIMLALARPFHETELKFRAGAVKGNRAMALVYVDARVIQDRLDEVLGSVGWQDDYEILDGGNVVCRLRLKIGDEWITKVDVGGPSEQPDGGDRLKAAFSDALKRAAVKFGIGRYLYRAPQQWVDYDPAKKCFVRKPSLAGVAGQAPAAAPANQAAPPSRPAGQNRPPADGLEFARRVQAFERELAKRGLCETGALIQDLYLAFPELPDNLAQWPGKTPAVADVFGVAMRHCLAFRDEMVKAKVQPPAAARKG